MKEGNSDSRIIHKWRDLSSSIGIADRMKLQVIRFEPKQSETVPMAICEENTVFGTCILTVLWTCNVATPTSSSSVRESHVSFHSGRSIPQSLFCRLTACLPEPTRITVHNLTHTHRNPRTTTVTVPASIHFVFEPFRPSKGTWSSSNRDSPPLSGCK